MIETAQSIIRSLQERWSRTSWVGKFAYLLLGVLAVTAVVLTMPFVLTLKSWFSSADPFAQAAVLIFLIVGCVGFLLYGWERAGRVDKLKSDVEQLQVRLANAELSAAQLQERWDHLLAVESRAGLWRRPCLIAQPDFIPKSQRRTRFLTVLNLKGGVGKTTLTGNIAACLATGDQPLRVLLIDIDFQGTLGDATVEPSLIGVQKQNQSYVNHLLTRLELDNGLIQRLAVPMGGVRANRVILAADTLDGDEFQLQAQFFVDPTAEPRFRFRMHLHLHRPAVFDLFDLVIFDCPPRVTTSVVNAVACSDYVLIPTKLDTGSINAVPRTMDWMRSLGATCPAEVIGVVASHVALRLEKPTKPDQESYENLRGRVQSTCGGDLLFKAVVQSTRLAIGLERGQVAGTNEEGREVFAAVVAELRQRMQI